MTRLFDSSSLPSSFRERLRSAMLDVVMQCCYIVRGRLFLFARMQQRYELLTFLATRVFLLFDVQTDLPTKFSLCEKWTALTQQTEMKCFDFRDINEEWNDRERFVVGGLG
mmetsp:Transcript_57364/g.139960  ORF Transcript_57364/g.139960 Transcript_57364/m.139960 type:complete len:111 (-) Transcript_57364:64-396(-)